MNYIVKQGDYLARIAAEHGFVDWQPIWQHEANRELRTKRKNPNVLYPGDKVVIPERTSKHVSVATEQRHTFKVERSPLKLMLALQDPYGQPIVEAQVKLAIGSEVVDLKTDSMGKLEHPLSADVTEASLTVIESGTSLGGQQIDLAIGHLDPITEPSGHAQRLRNLGYLAPAEELDDEQRALRHAIEEFQCDHQLGVDGICGPKTQEKLKKVYGC